MSTRIKLIGEADDGPVALEIIEEHRPELLLLDIQMPSMSGFDVLRLLPAEYNPPDFRNGATTQQSEVAGVPRAELVRRL